MRRKLKLTLYCVLDVSFSMVKFFRSRNGKTESKYGAAVYALRMLYHFLMMCGVDSRAIELDLRIILVHPGKCVMLDNTESIRFVSTFGSNDMMYNKTVECISDLFYTRDGEWDYRLAEQRLTMAAMTEQINRAIAGENRSPDRRYGMFLFSDMEEIDTSENFDLDGFDLAVFALNPKAIQCAGEYSPVVRLQNELRQAKMSVEMARGVNPVRIISISNLLGAACSKESIEHQACKFCELCRDLHYAQSSI